MATDVRYLLGDLELTDEGPRFRTTGGGSLDRGPCFYAPQVLRDDDRTLIWGWAQERRPQTEIDEAGWAGTLTFARELRLADDALVSTPAGELDALRARPLDVVGRPPVHGRRVRHRAPVRRRGSGCSTAGRSGSSPSSTDPRRTDHAGPRILVDGSIVEVFDGSATPFTTRAYPTSTSRWILRLARPAPLSAWTLEA